MTAVLIVALSLLAAVPMVMVAGFVLVMRDMSRSMEDDPFEEEE